MRKWMQRWSKRFGAARQGKRGRNVKVGWLIDTEEASFIWEPPSVLGSTSSNPEPSSKALQYCPGVLDFDRRTYVVRCPVDATIMLTRRPDGGLALADAPGAQNSIRHDKMDQLIHLMPPAIWRHPERPIMQFVTPYRFLSDDRVYVNQMPVFAHYPEHRLPGLLIGGRFPIDVWPRLLMWAFEWHDTSLPIHFRRGDPWFYVRFDTEDPAAHVRLVEAEPTDALAQYTQGLDGVTNFVNQTFSLFSTARARRPERLLVERKR